MMDRALVAELLAGQHDVRVLLHYADAAAAEARDRSTPIEGAYAPAYRNLAQAAKLRARANLDPFMHERLLQPPAELAQDAYQLVSSKVWSAPAACLAVQARPPRVVLVEWKRFDLPGVREATAIGWILALAEQLCAPQKPAALCVPACAGYFRALHERRYGLVFELPAHVGRYADLRRRDLHLRKPATLADLLADAAGRDAIDLGTRFRLAKLLAAAVHAAHTAGTTHKNIRASSVYFFPEESADGDGGPSKSRRKALDKPCLLDWGYVPTHIAPDAGTAVARVDPYHHPRRAKAAAGQVFLHSWDVYALGLVLLEIGLWQPLEAFMEELDDGAGPDAWRTHIMTRCVPDLRAQCGGIYESVVRKCLDLHYPGGEREVEVEKTLCWDICARLMLCNA
ncbi:hypothetical protein EDC01DRAFT_641830 [Geopyxis carbonaria]|nr:hypothetical protein EDC01DRAFT_641830 [Geopyxis carbonaria]